MLDVSVSKKKDGKYKCDVKKKDNGYDVTSITYTGDEEV